MEALGRSVLVQLMLAMTFIAAAFLLYMAQESQISVQQINLSVLRSDHMQLVANNTTLRGAATALQSTTRIDQTATTRLGMSTPDNSSYIWVPVAVSPLPAVHPVNADAIAAERQSAPLAWMGRFLSAVQSSL
jgi:cell division protein FtsL